MDTARCRTRAASARFRGARNECYSQCSVSSHSRQGLSGSHTATHTHTRACISARHYSPQWKPPD